jgi:hypothetical protein
MSTIDVAELIGKPRQGARARVLADTVTAFTRTGPAI